MSPEDHFSEKDIRVLDQIAQNPTISQRALARNTGISLGLINVIVKKFLKTGSLQITHLNKRKLEYLLTPEGFLAITRRTYRYVSKTITDYQRLQQQLTCLLRDLQKRGYESFSVYGDGELKAMLESLAPVIFQETKARLKKEHKTGPDAVVLNVTAEPMPPEFEGNVVSVLEAMG